MVGGPQPGPMRGGFQPGMGRGGMSGRGRGLLGKWAGLAGCGAKQLGPMRGGFQLGVGGAEDCWVSGRGQAAWTPQKGKIKCKMDPNWKTKLPDLSMTSV